MKIRPEAVISLQFLLQWSEISQLSAPFLCLHALLCVCVRTGPCSLAAAAAGSAASSAGRSASTAQRSRRCSRRAGTGEDAATNSGSSALSYLDDQTAGDCRAGVGSTLHGSRNRKLKMTGSPAPGRPLPVNCRLNCPHLIFSLLKSQS